MSNKDKQDGNAKDSDKDDEKSIPKDAQSKATFDERVEAAYNDCFTAVGTEEVVNIIESLDEDVRNDVMDKTINLLHDKLKSLKATLLTAIASVFVITMVAVMGGVYSVDRNASLQEHVEILAFKNLQLTEDNTRLQTQASNCLVSFQDAAAFKQRVYQSMQEINRQSAAVIQEINRQVVDVMDDMLSPVPEVIDNALLPAPEVIDNALLPAPEVMDDVLLPAPEVMDDVLLPAPEVMDDVLLPAPEVMDDSQLKLRSMNRTLGCLNFTE